MTGWRLGYVAGPKHFVAACGKIQSQVYYIYTIAHLSLSYGKGLLNIHLVSFNKASFR